MTFYLKLKGLKLAMAGTKAKAGQGHVQIYLDKIPSDAYTKMDMKNIFNVYPAPQQPKPWGTAYAVQADSAWIKAHRGQHTLKLALARNNDVLYRVTPISFKLNVQ